MVSRTKKNTLAVWSFLLLASHIVAASNELTLLTWSEYLDPEVIQDFEAKHGAKVNMVYYETDDTRDELMVTSSGGGYDLIVTNGTVIKKYQKSNLVQPLMLSEIPNIKHVGRKWLTLFESSEQYAVPLLWGTTGIVYRKDLIGKDIDSWKALLEPEEALRGKVAMINSVRDTVGMALKMLNYSANSERKEELEKATKVLLAQKPFVKLYSYISLDESSALLSGDIHIAMAYSGDALMLKQLNQDIAYVLPKEGGNIWVDYFTLSKESNNPKLAHEFLNFLNEPDNARKIAEYAYYASPNESAEKLLPKAFTDNPIIYPSEKALSKSENYRELSSRAKRRYSIIYSTVN